MFTWRLQLREVRLLLWKQHSLCASSHPAFHDVQDARKGILWGFSTRGYRQCDYSELWFVFMWKQHHWKQFNSRQSICACLWNSWVCSSCTDQFPCRQPQAHNEFIHWIQQPGIASSWQHSSSTSATSLGEISPGWQKSASDGMLGTYLFSFSAVIRIKSSCALPASLSKQDVPLPGVSDTRGAGFLCYWLNKIPSLSFSSLLQH